MNKKMMMGMAALAGIGVYALMMYKKKNPGFMDDMMCDMKSAAKDAAYKIAYSLDENF